MKNIIQIEYLVRAASYLNNKAEYNFQLAFNDYLESYNLRRVLVKEYSWAVPSHEALETIASYSPLIEIGAGSGYWAHLLQQMKANILPFDTAPPSTVENEFGHNKEWTKVWKGDESALDDHPERTLFLCWPPYQSSMAVNCLKRYKGEYFLYVGEIDGCNGDDDFWNYLNNNFEEEKRVTIPQWQHIHDVLVVYRRI